MNLHISKDLRRLAADAAAEFVRIADESIAQRGIFRVALSGGSTPKALYEKLVKAKIDWDRVQFYFGDERNVLADDENSNFRLANVFLFGPLNIASSATYRWTTEIGEPQKVAEDYVLQIATGFSTVIGTAPHDAGTSVQFEPSDIRFDLILLGMGPDGHTASLFPGTMALQVTGGLTTANWVPQLNQWRYTLTFPAINNARNVMFLVSGDEKAPALKAVLEGDSVSDPLPASLVRPTDGGLFWFVDRPAASQLTP